jgi:hypothetical protein
MDLQEVEWGFALGGSGSVYGQGAGAWECGNERLSSMKRGEFLDSQSNCWLLKKGYAPWGYLVG